MELAKLVFHICQASAILAFGVADQGEISLSGRIREKWWMNEQVNDLTIERDQYLEKALGASNNLMPIQADAEPFEYLGTLVGKVQWLAWEVAEKNEVLAFAFEYPSRYKKGFFVTGCAFESVLKQGGIFTSTFMSPEINLISIKHQGLGKWSL